MQVASTSDATFYRISAGWTRARHSGSTKAVNSASEMPSAVPLAFMYSKTFSAGAMSDLVQYLFQRNLSPAEIQIQAQRRHEENETCGMKAGDADLNADTKNFDCAAIHVQTIEIKPNHNDSFRGFIVTQEFRHRRAAARLS